MTDEWTRAEKRKAQSEQAKAIMNFVSMLSDKIAELEKENAELKKQLGMSNKVYNDNLDYSHHIEGQLTKAREIIRDFISVAIDYIDKEDKNYSYIAEAEQFLKNDDCPNVMCENCTKEDCGIRQLGLVEVEK